MACRRPLIKFLSEHLWQYLNDRLDRFSCRSNKPETFNRLKDFCEKIQQSVLQNLVDCMPRRLLSVIIAKDGSTKFSSSTQKVAL